MFKWYFATPLWLRVMLALGLGIITGIGLKEGLVQWGLNIGVPPEDAQAIATLWLKTYIAPLGDLFMRLLRMVVVPLIFTSLVAGMVALGDPKKLGSVGIKTLGLYLLMTFTAVAVGLGFGSLFQPGVGLKLDASNIEPLKSVSLTLSERLLAIVPQNPLVAMVEGDIIAIIFFALLFGIGIILCGPSAKLVGDVFTAAAEAMLKVTQLVMEFAPIGVFALIAYTVARQGVEAFSSILIMIACVYAGLFVYMLVTYTAIIKFWLGLSLRRFFIGVADAGAVGFSTASSSATLPVTIACTTKKLGVNPSIAGSTLPLGATINMDGTALYLGILAVFTAQMFGYDLSLGQYIIIAITATLSAIGAAGIPSASLFLASAVLSTFGATPEQIALVIGFILPVDRIMDMARTSINVMSDSVVAVAVAKWEGELDQEVYNGTKAYVPPPEALDDLIP
jgi:Na+/H+-dicarboxylate symporter